MRQRNQIVEERGRRVDCSRIDIQGTWLAIEDFFHFPDNNRSAEIAAVWLIQQLIDSWLQLPIMVTMGRVLKELAFWQWRLLLIAVLDLCHLHKNAAGFDFQFVSSERNVRSRSFALPRVIMRIMMFQREKRSRDRVLSSTSMLPLAILLKHLICNLNHWRRLVSSTSLFSAAQTLSTDPWF